VPDFIDDAALDQSDQTCERPTERLLLRPEEAAGALAISRSKLYQLLGNGELASVHIGTSRRIAADELRRYVAQLEPAAAPGASAP
jgi:excisionase family DNA binding protein